MLGTPRTALLCGAGNTGGCTWKAQQQLAKIRAACIAIQQALQAIVGRIRPAPRVGEIAMVRLLYPQRMNGAVRGTAAVLSSSTQQQHSVQLAR